MIPDISVHNINSETIVIGTSRKDSLDLFNQFKESLMRIRGLITYDPEKLSLLTKDRERYTFSSDSKLYCGTSDNVRVVKHDVLKAALDMYNHQMKINYRRE